MFRLLFLGNCISGQVNIDGHGIGVNFDNVFPDREPECVLI